MGDIAEKRVYGEAAGRVTLYAACALGVVTVRAAAGRVGESGVAARCDPAGIAGDGARVAVAAGDDVLVGPEPFEPAGFGPAAAVGVDGDRVLAAAPDGRVGATAADGWTDLGAADGVAAFDGGLVAARSGVHRAVDGLPHVGLSGVRDVAAAGPLAAAADGLYALGNGWMRVLDGDWTLVAAARDGPAHAAGAGGFRERADGGWDPVELPGDARVVDVAYADCPYALTRDGDLVTRPDPGAWRREPLGLDGPVGIVAGP